MVFSNDVKEEDVKIQSQDDTNVPSQDADGEGGPQSSSWTPASADDLEPLFDVEVEELTFKSSDRKSTIAAQIWAPVLSGTKARPCGIVQLVHGMSEHIRRYDRFARLLAGVGYVVCGHDHIGHGRSARSADDLGCLPSDGKELLIEDVHKLRQIVAARFPGQLYALFGHSMGSFIVRAYLARHGVGVRAAIICGTGQQPYLLSTAGRLLALLLCRLRGPRYRSKLIDGMAVGAYGKQIRDARTPQDWICTDPAVIDAYREDELCGFMFSVGGYATLLDLTRETATLACARHVPEGVPLLFVAGDGDPVGNCGRGVQAAAKLARRAGSRDVDVRIYPGMRHEVLNEPDHAQVDADILGWLEAKM